jgi:hypothetical protein
VTPARSPLTLSPPLRCCPIEAMEAMGFNGTLLPYGASTLALGALARDVGLRLVRSRIVNLSESD